MDVLWLRNPFAKLSRDGGEDLQISCDSYNGRRLDESNPANTGFYFVESNARTVALFDEWYGRRKDAASAGLKEQDVLSRMKSEGAFGRLNVSVGFLDTLYFSGFCEDSRDFREVRTVHANCCRMAKAKLADLAAALAAWMASRGTPNATWPAHRACHEAWQTDISDYELRNVLQKVSMANRTLIISVLNEAYAEEKGMLDLFLGSLERGVGTASLVKHLLLVAVDQAAYARCELLKLHCYRLFTRGVDLSKEQLYMSRNFIEMMWRRTLFLRDVLKLGYSFIFTDMDVLWLRDPFRKLNRDGEDMLLSCDRYNGSPLDESNPANTGFYFAVSGNKTVALFGAWYASRNASRGMKEQDVLGLMISKGVFGRLGMRVRFLDTLYFSGFCQDSRDLGEVSTVHANCCRGVKAKIADLSASLETWKRFNNGTEVLSWPEHKACNRSWYN